MANYEDLLKRARKNMPHQTVEEVRFELPKFDSFIEGTQTIIKNFADVAKTLHREPEHLLKFLQAETGTSGIIEDKRLVLKVQKKVELLNDKLSVYIRDFVMCKECKKYDSELRKVGHIEQLKCKACGAKYTVKKL
ncbi:TPA: translation initiation factor IF-2 subunit beta [archaeon]|nr:translation initiation factor IF-2 subunit beta [Candidatus Naiadarchaeales archaeon SRR2090153.bin461]